MVTNVLTSTSFKNIVKPCQADTPGYKAFAGAPKSDIPHALIWHNHIKSYTAVMNQFSQGGEECWWSCCFDDENVDLFGSDREEDEDEKKKIT